MKANYDFERRERERAKAAKKAERAAKKTTAPAADGEADKDVQPAYEPPAKVE